MLKYRGILFVTVVLLVAVLACTRQVAPDLPNIYIGIGSGVTLEEPLREISSGSRTEYTFHITVDGDTSEKVYKVTCVANNAKNLFLGEHRVTCEGADTALVDDSVVREQYLLRYDAAGGFFYLWRNNQ